MVERTVALDLALTFPDYVLFSPGAGLPFLMDGQPEELAALYGRSEYVCYMLGAGFLACFVSLAYSSIKQRITRANNLARFDMAKASIRERQVLAVMFSIKSALFGTQAVVLAKSLSMLLIQALHPSPAYSNPLLSYQTYFIVLGFAAAATYWVTRLNHALRLFEAVYLIPMMQIAWIVFSSLAGGIYYEEFIGFGLKEYCSYAVGFVCVLVGVAMLCPRDDARSMNAADVIYEIVTDDHVSILSPRPAARFEAFGQDDVDGAVNGTHLAPEAHETNGFKLVGKGYEQIGMDDEVEVFRAPVSRQASLEAGDMSTNGTLQGHD
jgi:hypothetical protein